MMFFKLSIINYVFVVFVFVFVLVMCFYCIGFVEWLLWVFDISICLFCFFIVIVGMY